MLGHKSSEAYLSEKKSLFCWLINHQFLIIYDVVDISTCGNYLHLHLVSRPLRNERENVLTTCACAKLSTNFLRYGHESRRSGKDLSTGRARAPFCVFHYLASISLLKLVFEQGRQWTGSPQPVENLIIPALPVSGFNSPVRPQIARCKQVRRQYLAMPLFFLFLQVRGRAKLVV